MLKSIKSLCIKLYRHIFVEDKNQYNYTMLNQKSKRDLTTMFNQEQISRKCLDTVSSRYWAYNDSEIAILDLGTMLAVEIIETKEVMHFNKFSY